jgi:hypothetical protein
VFVQASVFIPDNINRLAYFEICPFPIMYESEIFYIIGPRDRIHNTPFSLQPTNRLGKLDCYITLIWKVLPRTKTLAYWAHSEVMKKIDWGLAIKAFIYLLNAYSQHFIFFIASEWAQ